MRHFITSAPIILAPVVSVEIDGPELTDAERDARDGDQWLSSVEAYLTFRAGSAWRKIHREGERYNAKRWYYLDAIRVLKSLRYASCAPCNCSRCNPRPKVVATAAAVAHQAVA